MMIARLLVERGSVRDRSEDWGEYRFVALPSPGDRIAAERETVTHYLTVLCVHHKPQRLDEGPEPAGADAPLAHVVAKWTGSD